MTVPETQIDHAVNLENIVQDHFPEGEKEKYLAMLKEAREQAPKDFHITDQILNLVGHEVNRVLNQK